jgi:hypothetical protein
MRLPLLKAQSFYFRATNFLVIGLTLQALAMFPAHAATSTQQLTSSPSMLRFGSIDLGKSESLLITLTNTNPTSVTITDISSSNSEFSTAELSMPMVVPAGQSVDVNVIFTPTSSVWTSENIRFICDAPTPALALQVMGTGTNSVALVANPPTLSFNQVAVGAKVTLPVVITNDRTSDVTIPSILSTSGEFSVTGANVPLTLSNGQSVTVDVTFAPQSSGTIGGSIFVSPGLVIPLSGTSSAATGQLVLSPAPLNFGDVAVGNTATQSLTLSAIGTSVTVSSAASGSSQFVLDGASFPFTIAAGQSQSFNVAFTPQNSGVQSSSLSFTSNASDSQAVESLSGTGTVDSYSVNLYWNPSTDVTGYNVYRSTASNGNYSKINSSLDPTTAFTDTTVASGQTYYYAATSVNSTGQESSRSTPPVEAVVP